ncbi:SLAP domain-containing protein [Heliorestis convoluta]|uniref:SLAP domain-containing protein n=1 Tax=Heliorestis convoluta TaxID=356322 RepID=A0A5Q2N5E3_9FIRM|nr:SLAP domain-containing protein [Heliorestis convoluta]QGG47460.1 hypothetical protein FTV88_1313 [Heliorestis convoluta]
MQGEVIVEGSILLNLDDVVQVSATFKNNLKQPVIFEEIPLLLVDKKGKILAKQAFNLSEMGRIAPGEKKKWDLAFDRKNVLVDQIKQDNWAILFDMEDMTTGQKDFELEGLPEGYPPEQEEKLKAILKKMPIVKPGEVSFTPLHATVNKGQLLVAVMIRNGGEKTLKIDALPLLLLDAQGEEAAKAQFQLENFLVSPGKARLWTFVFPEEMVQKKNPDLSSWSLQIKSTTPKQV